MRGENIIKFINVAAEVNVSIKVIQEISTMNVCNLAT